MSNDQDLPVHEFQLTGSQWLRIARTLFPGADHTWFRRELELISRRNESPRKLAEECWNRADLCDRFRKALPQMELIPSRDLLAQKLSDQIRRERELAQLYEQIGKNRMPRKFLSHCRLLWLWQHAGGDLRTRGTPATGAVISFMQAASVVVGGKAPGLWQINDIIKRYKRANFTVISSTTHVAASPTFIPARKT